MPKVNQPTLDLIRSKFERYKNEVRNSPLREKTKVTYTRHVETFIRWLNDDFEPGGTLK